jgi:hypothetical protein
MEATMNKFTLDGNWHPSDFAAINPFGQTRDQEPRRKKAKTVVFKEPPGRKPKPVREPLFTYDPTPEHLEKIRANSAKAKSAYQEGIEREYNLLLDIARKAKESIGEYGQYLYGTNHKCLARRGAWEQFIKECARQRGLAIRENTLRRAIRVVMDGTGERWMMPDQHTTRAWIREVVQ